MRRKPRCSAPVDPEGMTIDASRESAAGRAERTAIGEGRRPVAGAIRGKGFGASRSLIAGWAGGSNDWRKPEVRSPIAAEVDSQRKLEVAEADTGGRRPRLYCRMITI